MLGERTASRCIFGLSKGRGTLSQQRLMRLRCERTYKNALSASSRTGQHINEVLLSRMVTGAHLYEATLYENALCSHNVREMQTRNGAKSGAAASGPKLDSSFRVNVMHSGNRENPASSRITTTLWDRFGASEVVIAQIEFDELTR